MWKPRLRSSELVFHSSSTPPPDCTVAWKPVTVTAVGETIVVIVDEKLFKRFGSEVEDVTLAVFAAKLLELNVVAVVLIVTVTEAPLVSVPSVQVTVPLACT